MNTMMRIIKDLAPLNRVFCSDDYDKSIEYLQALLPFKVIEYNKADEYNGWVIPPRWDVTEAKIIKDGKLILDGATHALSVIALSKSFKGTVDREELKKHLYYDQRYDDAIPFHFRQMYRSWDRDWGFCVTRNFFNSLQPGKYEVLIETKEAEGTLKLLEYTHRGKMDETFVFAAHLDHPGMANDDLAGCAVGVELFRRLVGKSTKYSYRLFLHQEVIGSEYYLGKMDDAERSKILESLFIEMPGSKTQLALQFSNHGDSTIEKTVVEELRKQDKPHRTGAFGTIVSVGDYVWESYGIPMSILTRFPYPEYHCDRDNYALMCDQSIDEVLDLLQKVIERIESTSLVFKNFTGNICTSNPCYNLYVDPGQAAFGGFSDDNEIKGMRALMDIIPVIKKPVSVQELAEQAGLPAAMALSYLQKWMDKGLLLIK